MLITVVAYPNRSRGVVEPAEFLEWAKADIKPGGRRGIANAMTNAKRAIHARIDELVFSLRVTHASDWPQHPPTELLLQFLGQADVSIRSVVRLLTGQRNTLEHQYRLPTQDAARAAVEIAELWLGKSEAHLRPRLMVVDLSASSFSVRSSAREQRQTVEIHFAGREPATFFWDARRRIVKLKPDGSAEEIGYATLRWKELVRLQIAHRSLRHNGHALPPHLAGLIFRAYRRWLRGHGAATFRASCKYVA